ncbi:hypothetical protein PanWU01x14_342100, partial [Parasponia andersonii]
LSFIFFFSPSFCFFFFLYGHRFPSNHNSINPTKKNQNHLSIAFKTHKSLSLFRPKTWFGIISSSSIPLQELLLRLFRDLRPILSINLKWLNELVEAVGYIRQYNNMTSWLGLLGCTSSPWNV